MSKKKSVKVVGIILTEMVNEDQKKQEIKIKAQLYYLLLSLMGNAQAC